MGNEATEPRSSRTEKKASAKKIKKNHDARGRTNVKGEKKRGGGLQGERRTLKRDNPRKEEQYTARKNHRPLREGQPKPVNQEERKKMKKKKGSSQAKRRSWNPT